MKYGKDLIYNVYSMNGCPRVTKMPPDPTECRNTEIVIILYPTHFPL